MVQGSQLWEPKGAPFVCDISRSMSIIKKLNVMKKFLKKNLTKRNSRAKKRATLRFSKTVPEK